MNVLVTADGKGDDKDMKQEQRVNEGDWRSVMTEVLMYCKTVGQKRQIP
jgi:hypothetical protein